MPADDKQTDQGPPKTDAPSAGDKQQGAVPPATPAAPPPAPDPEAEKMRAELEELRKFKAQQEADAKAAETKRLEEAGKFEEVKAKLEAEAAQREASFRAELAARDIRSRVLEHLAEGHRDKLDLVIPAVQAAAGELKWDGLSLKTDVAKAAREVIAKLGFGVAADDKGGAKGADKGRRQGAPPPPAPKPERHHTSDNAGPQKPARIPMRELVREAVEDVLGSRGT